MKRDWKQVLNDQAAAREDREPRRSIGVNMPNRQFALVAQAAANRGLSYTAYARRALIAFAEADLGFDWNEEMADEPGIIPIDGSEKFKRGKPMAGTGYGPWKIVALEQHAPRD